MSTQTTPDQPNKSHPSTTQSSLAQSSEPHSIFDTRQKALIVCIVSTAATFSGFASNIYFPALPTIAHDLKASTELVNLTVTSYLMFQGLAPSFWGPISDVKGRRVAYVCTFIVFVGACIGLALTKNYATLIVLRCLQSTGSASTIAIGSGVIGDITTRETRGGFMGIFQAGLLVPVAVGPVIGGALAGSLGWRSIFWFLTIYSAVFLLLLSLLLPETLRSIVGNGSITPASLLYRYPLTIYQKTSKTRPDPDSALTIPQSKKVDLIGPFHILISKQAAPIVTFLAIYYTVWQMSITAMSTLFTNQYHLTETQLGLAYIPNGAGSMIGTLITGRILDIEYHRIQAKHSQLDDQEAPTTINNNNPFPLEKARLRLIPIFALLQCLAIALFGWMIQYPHHVPIAVPIAATFVTGWTAVSTQSTVMTYLVDVFADRSAAASASLNLARCLAAAAGTSAITPLVDAVGVGPAFSACVAVQAVASLGLVVQWRCGGRWRGEMEERQRAKIGAAATSSSSSS